MEFAEGGVCSWQYLKEEHPRQEETKGEPTGNWLCLDFLSVRSATKLNCPIEFVPIAGITKGKKLSNRVLFCIPGFCSGSLPGVYFI
jgi:hypothetical protein